MSVGQVSNGSEMHRLKPKDVAERKKIEQQKHAPESETPANSRTDSVQISHEAKKLLNKMIAENENATPSRPELAELDQKVFEHIKQELGQDFEAREERIREVLIKLQEEYYNRPEVLFAASKQILDELIGG